jgi:hypothetical protein
MIFVAFLRTNPKETETSSQKVGQQLKRVFTLFTEIKIKL